MVDSRSVQATCRRVEKIYSTGLAFAVVFDAEVVPVPGGVSVPVDGGILFRSLFLLQLGV